MSTQWNGNQLVHSATASSPTSFATSWDQGVCEIAGKDLVNVTPMAIGCKCQLSIQLGFGNNDGKDVTSNVVSKSKMGVANPLSLAIQAVPHLNDIECIKTINCNKWMMLSKSMFPTDLSVMQDSFKAFILLMKTCLIF